MQPVVPGVINDGVAREDVVPIPRGVLRPVPTVTKGARSPVPRNHTFSALVYASDFDQLSLKFFLDFVLSAGSLIFSLNHSYATLHVKQKDRLQFRNPGRAVVCDCLSRT